jgi:hydroxymethylglutaryl-CoA lyase
MTRFVRIFEMSPRDGLQNEKRLVPAADKIRLVDLLSRCGFTHIETASFVSPKWVPQMADGAAVLAGIVRTPGIAYTALVPNLVGYEAARAAHADEVAVFAAASETFSRRNINCTIAESIERFRPVLAAARADGVPVRGYVSCVTDCPYEGQIPPKAVAHVAVRLLEIGCREISLGDTIGRGSPERIGRMLEAVLQVAPAERLAGHYHDTSGMALANIETSLALGIGNFDASVGGLGGCPYAPGAKGNVDTLAVFRRLRELGYATGLDEPALEEAARFARSLRTVAA